MNSDPLPSGSRFTPSIDFGVAKLNIKSAAASDAGVYTCSATNAFGAATTSGTVKVSADANVVSGTQHPSGQGHNSLETFWIEFWLEKPLKIPF